MWKAAPELDPWTAGTIRVLSIIRVMSLAVAGPRSLAISICSAVKAVPQGIDLPNQQLGYVWVMAAPDAATSPAATHHAARCEPLWPGGAP